MFKSSSLGFDKLWNDGQMFLAMLRRQFTTLLIVQIIGFSVFVFAFKPKGIGGETGLCIYKAYLQTLAFQTFDSKVNLECGGFTGNVSLRDFSAGGYYEKFAKTCNRFLLNSFILSCLIYVIIPVWMIIAHVRNKKDMKDKILRGVGMIEPEEVKDFIKKNPILFKGYMFKLTDNVLLPESIATRNNLTIGRPGSGKSQMIYRIIEQLREQKFRQIIHDLKGDMISNFYDEKTCLIFNPVDKRMVKWSLFKELETIIDIQSFCNALVSTEGNDPFWPESAKNLLSAILTLCKYKRETNYDCFWGYINTPNDKLKAAFDETPGCESGSKALAEGKMAASVQAVLATSVQALQYLSTTGLDRFEISKNDAPQEMLADEFSGYLRKEEDCFFKKYQKDITGKVIVEEYYKYYKESEMFSVKEWINGAGKYKNYKTIFLSNQVAVQSAVKSFLGMFVQFATTALCSLPDYTAPKTFFILDEFGQLPKMDGILTLLTQGRSKNGAGWLLIQDVAQIKKIYGNEGSSIIINNCGNLSFFSVSDEETAQTLSKSVGSVEIKRTDESRSMSWHDAKDSFSQSEKIQENALILPKEIMDLPTLTFVIKMVDIPVTKDKFGFAKYETVAKAFIPFDILKSEKKDEDEEKEEQQKQEKTQEVQQMQVKNNFSEVEKNMDIEERLQNIMAFDEAFYDAEKIENDIPDEIANISVKKDPFDEM
ncbi:MAG: type IV secretion system DNA-binding domain-containing protein [Chitinivibrionia bacterium]|nr:type IV secretion system DNA-binding domain-containing protein [Chitinivibrionia bacterium]